MTNENRNRGHHLRLYAVEELELPPPFFCPPLLHCTPPPQPAANTSSVLPSPAHSHPTPHFFALLPGAPLLMDFEKAYDLVDRAFLEDTKVCMGFQVPWVRGVLTLCSSAHTQFLTRISSHFLSNL